MTLFGKDPRKAFTPLSYLQYKFTDLSGSSWAFPFWASLIGVILSKIPLLPSKIRSPLGKIATGTLIGSTIGGLAISGGTPSNPVQSPSSQNPTNPIVSSKESYWG